MKVSSILLERVLYDYEVANIVTDSRKVSSKDIFVCLNTIDSGDNYIDDVIEKGCKTIVTEKLETLKKYKEEKINLIYTIDTKKKLSSMLKKFYGDLSKDIRVIAVTGTNGKTTVTTLCYQYLKYLKIKSSLIGTNGIIIGNKKYKNDNTTPSITKIYEVMRESIDEGIHYLFIEASSHGIKEQRMQGLTIHTSLVTNITRDHLDYHKTMDDYIYTKLYLLIKAKHQIINIDDENICKMIPFLNDNIYTYGFKENAKYHITKTSTIDEKQKIVINDNEVFFTNLIGIHNSYNIASLYAIVDTLQLDKSKLNEFLNEQIVIPGRMELIKTNKGSFLVDFAHTPDGVFNILKTVKDNLLKQNGKIIVVMGMGGNRDVGKRIIVGKILDAMADIIILTNDNPRCEDEMQIIYDIKEGIVNTENYTVLERKDAILLAYELSKTNDYICVLGKGCEDTMEINDKFIHFNDVEEINKIIKGN